jgi:cation diffusion facilitator CzcD-associated flavoprotein CzcO
MVVQKGESMDKVTCIVVGAGPSGTACAYALAQKGIETVLLERGRTPGEKNVSSFVLYTSVLKHFIPDFRQDLPVERNVVRMETIYMAAKTIEDAIKKKDFSKRTMKNYLKYLDTTKLIDMVHESRRASDQISGKALENGSDQMAAAAEIYNQYWDSTNDIH